MDIDEIRHIEGIKNIFPDMFSQGESRDGPATGIQEELKNCELLGGKGQQFAVLGCFTADGVEADIVRPQ